MKKIITTVVMAISLLTAQAQQLTSGPITFTVINEDTKELAVSRIQSDEYLRTFKIEGKYVFNQNEYHVSTVKELAIQSSNIEHYIFDESIKTFESPLAVGQVFLSIIIPSNAQVTYPILRRSQGEKLQLPGTCKAPKYVCYNSKIEHLMVGEGVESINSDFIDEPSYITKLYMPSTIKYFNADVIRLANVKELYLKSPVPPTTDGYVWVYQFDTMTLYVPEEYIDAYKSDPAWSKFKQIRPMGYIPNYNTFEDDPSAVGELEADSADTKPEYYTLQGIRTMNPAQGEIYIVRRGAKVTKEIIGR